MSIAVGDRLPEVRVSEYIDTETPSCKIGTNVFQVAELVKGKKIVIFGVPAAFSPTCSDSHLPGYIALADSFKAKGVDEIWCLSVNDAYVMGAWGRAQKVNGVVRMIADGGAAFTKAMGLEFDLTKAGMGMRSQRYSMVVEDGVVTKLNVDAGGKLEVSGAQKLLESL